MPRAQKTEKVVIVRTDLDGNVLDYDVVQQPIRPVGTARTPPVNRSQPTKQSPKLYRTQTYDDEEDEEFEGDIDDDQETIRDVSATHAPRKKTRRDVATGGTVPSARRRRRDRYVRPKSTVKIFEEKVDWYADRKVDARNDEAIERIRNAPKKKVFGETLNWRVKPRIDTHNEEVVENFRRRPSKPGIFIEKPIWISKSKVDTHNEEVVTNLRRAPKPQIYDEKLKWEADPKIDTHNESAVERIKSAPKPFIYDEKFSWTSRSNPKVDHHNEEYLKHKERERIIQSEKSYVQSFPHERRTKPDRARIDHYNTEFVEHKKRQKSARLPPIEDRKLEWQKTPRINYKNDDYIERIRQKRSIPLIFREKLKWHTKTPRIEAHNEEYVDKLKDQSRPRIINRLPRWKSQAKIDAFNESYDPSSHTKPVQIVNEKLRWHARPKIDTNLETDSEEDEYSDDYEDEELPV